MSADLSAFDPVIVMIGCFDAKGEEFTFLYECLEELGVNVYTINAGCRKTKVNFPINKTAEDVAKAASANLNEVRKMEIRGEALEVMAQGAQRVLQNLLKNKNITGVIGMGGGGGTYLTLQAMQSLPLEVAKVCISTVASKDLSRQVGDKNIMLMPSIVDISGLNKISRLVIKQAAGAIAGMASVTDLTLDAAKKTIAISMFGNTTACVVHCSELLEKQGYEVLCFHAVGSGGRTMEALISEGLIDAVLDVTTTELADELCNGICSAGPERLEAAGRMGIPQVVVPGCIDMVNFAHVDSIPDEYSDRLFFNWSPDVTLMRTNKIENIQLGQLIAKKLNQAKGKVAILLPLHGISIVSSKGNLFHNAEIDQVLFETINSSVQKQVKVKEISQNINDKEFAEQAVSTLLELM